MTKYGAKKTVVDNVRFDSKAESEYYKQLKLLKRANEIQDFELQPTFVLHDGFVLNGKKYQPIKYKGDFLVTHLDGRKEVIDVKGVKTQVYDMKKKMFLNRYRDYSFLEVIV
jgi:hypothetical protein